MARRAWLMIAGGLAVVYGGAACSSSSNEANGGGNGGSSATSVDGAGGQPQAEAGPADRGRVTSDGAAESSAGQADANLVLSSDAAKEAALGASDAGATRSPLPVPPGGANVAKPIGNAADLKVVPWAGFKAAVTYTFDDAQPSQIDHFADIQATHVPVTFYITTSNNYYAGYDDTWKQALASGDELGNHTAHHCNFDLTNCTGPLGTPEAEIDQCTDYLKQTLGAPDVFTIAYPYGDTGYEPDAKTRFLLGRGVGGGMVGPGDDTDPFNLPIMAAQGGESADVFSGSVDSARTQGKWLIFLFHSLLPDSQNWYAGVDMTSVSGSIDHAKAATDVWIDTLVNVGAYWLGERTIEHASESSAGGQTTWTWTLPRTFPREGPCA